MKSFFMFTVLFSFVTSASAATYEVPVNEELKGYATFELPNFTKTVDDGEVTIKYDLPDLLTGVPEEIVLEGYNITGESSFMLFGKKAFALCGRQEEKIKCAIQYTNLKINQEKALEAIQNVSKTEEESSFRFKVMRSFSTDPVGFIIY